MENVNRYRGDSWELEYQIIGKDGKPLNVTEWKIKCEIKDKNISIKKANNKVIGGSVDEIRVLDTLGNIIININKEETKQCNKGKYLLEIEITSSDGKKRYTMEKDVIEVFEDIITWEEK